MYPSWKWLAASRLPGFALTLWVNAHRLFYFAHVEQWYPLPCLRPGSTALYRMKHFTLTAVMCLGLTAFAQQVHFDYDRSANFGAYKTYQWVDYGQVDVGDQLLDQDIKSAVDEQLAGKGLRRVDSGGDLLVGYKASISQEKQLNGYGWGGGPWGFGPWDNFGNINATTSTIDIGTLNLGLLDPATKRLVWRGSAAKTLDIEKDPDKNYATLQKAMAKLFKNYPPQTRNN
jgi:hypothetical protein